MMVARLLRTEHGIDAAPTPGDFEILEDEIRANGSTDIRVAIALGRGSTFSVKQHWWGNEDRDLAAVLEAATAIAENISSVDEMRREIIDMTSDAVGATGRIDSVVVKAMREAGHDIAEVLKLLADTDGWIVDVGERGNEDRMFRLRWDKGDVYAPITLADGASWNEGRLIFQKVPSDLSRARGQRVREIVDNPILGDIRVTSGSDKKGEVGSLDCTQDLLHFDADTGRLWAA